MSDRHTVDDAADTLDYLFDTADPGERQRLAAHAVLWDPFTFRKLAETGVGDGWQCLEIGAGTGSVAAWLARQVGRRGRVVATDIETRWLEPMATGNLVVRRHDIAGEPLSDDRSDGYDLIHARLVLEHLPQRGAVVDKLVAALRPGGWLVVEDYDIRTMAHTEPPLPEWSAVIEAVVVVMPTLGSDPVCGNRLLSLLRDAELVDVSGEGFLRPMPIPALAPIFRPALQALHEPLVQSGAVTADQVAAAMRAYDGDPITATSYTPILVATAGRRPP